MDSVPEVTPMRSYNFRKAKLNSSVAWLLSKAYSDREEPPADLLDPLYQDNGEDHVKPSVIYQLASGELYSRVCSNIFPPTIHPWDGHVAIIQGFSRRGIYVVDDRNQPVTESILSQTQKIKLNGHVAMMDAIMKAYVNETISIENVVQAVRKFTTFNASSDLPFDLEDALLFWINKVCLAVEHRVERDRKTHQANIMQSAAPAIRVKRDQVQPKEMLHFPKMNNIMKDLSDGCCLATIIHHYYPHLLSLEDVTLQESMSFADSLHNLQVITSFFQRNLPHLLHFTLEDLLYCHDSMKANILALIAEMFYCFEVEKPSHLEASQGGFQPSTFTQMNSPMSAASRPPLPISDATKRSFHAQSPKADTQSVDLTKVPSSPNTQRRLLNRQQQERSSIFGDNPGDENTPPLEYQTRSLQRSTSREQQKQHPGSQSILAWEEKEGNRTTNSATFTRPRRLQDSPTVNMQSSRAGSLLANVSIDSEMNESQDFSGLDIEINPLPERMGSPSSQETNPSGQQHGQDRLMTLTQQRPVTQEGQVESEDLEVESLTSSRMSQRHPPGESYDPMLTHRTDPVMNGVNGSQGALSSPGTFRGSQREQLDNVASPASDSGSVDSTISRKNLKLDVHPVDILGSPRGPTNEFMPAVVRPLKEKSHQTRKMDERGDHMRHRNKHKAGDPRMNAAASQQSHDPGSDSSESVDATTPLSGESIADSLAGDLALQRARMARGGGGGFMLAPAAQSNQPQVAKGKHGEAFFISGSEEDDGRHSSSAPTGARSFTIAEGAMTVDDAKQAGIPVVSASRSMQGLNEHGFRMRQGGMTSSQSDQELYQPHPQHSHSFQNPVSSAAAPSSLPYSMHESYSNPHNPHQYQPNPQFNPQSSNPQHANPHHANPHSNPHGNPHHDLRTRSPHHHISQPNPYGQQVDPEAYAHDQRGVSTWGHHQQQQFHPHSTNPGAAGNGFHMNPGEAPKSGDLSSSELTHIRLRLEEKRRLMDYERHKLERQWNKQRQRVGKAAFLQVLANKKQEKEANGEDQLRSERQRNIDNPQPPQGLTTFAALSANREKSQIPQEPSVSEQEQHQHTIQEKQLTQAYFLAQQNQMAQQQAQKTPRNQPQQAEHRAQPPSPSHFSQVQMTEGGRRSNESPRSGRDSDSPRMRSESPGPRRAESPGSSSGSHSPHLTQEEYNTSLEKLNANLSQLQNQILRLSLQQEEFKKGMQESPRQVQESPRQSGQRDFGDHQDGPEQRNIQRPPSRPQQDISGQTTGFYIDTGEQKPMEQDTYVLEENPAFSIAQGQPLNSPQGIQHTQHPPEGFSLSQHSQPTDIFNEKQTVNANRLSDVTYIKSEMNDNKYIIPDNLEQDGVVADVHMERTFSGQNLNLENENQSQLKHMPAEEVHSPPANQRKGQPVMAFDIDMGSPKPRAPPANQRKKEAPPKKAPEKKTSPPRTPVKKQAPPSVYEIVGEGEEEVPVPSDMTVRPLEPMNSSREDDGDSSGMAAGFIIGEDDKAQDELAKRKEMFLKARLKREEEAKIKKASREAEAEKKREELRKKQEEAEMKKAEQAARREQIRLEYQRKKQAELDPDSAPPPPRKQKSSKPRPKSQMVTSDKGPTHSHGFTALDGASDVALSVQKKSYTIESSSEGEVVGATASQGSGPKLFVKPASKSNRHIIINAISHCILAGVVNEKTKDKVLQEVAKSDQKHFMILFRDHSLQFRALYSFTPESEELTKVYGTGPRHITNKMTEALYKYNSGGKHFAKVPSKSLSVQIDGVTISSAFWQSKRTTTTKKH